MSKKVTIPTDGGNPFVVILGGVKYVYKPGETVDVPDGVALEIEERERWRDKYRGAVQPPFAAGGGGVQPDLSQNDPNAADYVKNRTHYEAEEIVNEPLNITWDGNTEGLVSVADVFHKVSDLVLTDEQIQLITVRDSSGNTSTIDNDCVTAEDITIFGFPAKVSVVKKDNVELEGVVFPKKGIYFMSTEGIYISSITTTEPVPQTKTVVKKLDKKFLPDDIGGGVFRVNLTLTETANTYTADKTFNEIVAAYKSGMSVEAVTLEAADGMEFIGVYYLATINTFENLISFTSAGYMMGNWYVFQATMGVDGNVVFTEQKVNQS